MIWPERELAQAWSAKAPAVASVRDGTLLVQLFAIVRDDVAVSIRTGGK